MKHTNCSERNEAKWLRPYLSGATRRYASQITTAALVFVFIGLAISGCENILGPSSPAEPNRAGGDMLAAGATLDSARLFLHVGQANGQWVIVRPVTAPWDEATVTWNTVGPWLSPFIVGSFTARDTGWISLDVTALVSAWLNGIWQNYGIILDQDPPNILPTVVHSRETKIKRAKLRIYSSAGMVEQVSVQDAFVRDVTPNANNGADSVLLTGWAGEPTGENRTLLKFGVAPPEPVSSLGDRVWYDANANGVQDGGEAGIAGVAVDLYNCSDVLLASTVTDGSGNYFFDSLVAGDYVVAFTAPAGHSFSAPAEGGDAALDSDADPATGRTGCITLAGGINDGSWDAGFYVPGPDLPGCTYGMGFWKNHCGFGPQEDLVSSRLPVVLGEPGGAKSLHVDDAATAYAVLGMQTYGHASNGITKLYAQLLVAKLNIAAGADDDAILADLADADAFLASNDWTAWSSLEKAGRNIVQHCTENCGLFNKGAIGPGHCGDDGE